ncbi:hypothetical protein [Stappia indica]|uniref:hypothetical protein n=1 Tax=Stappia indica TaxID=538381 RepID=UPI000831EF2F|nr:hypothetical protein [Stappia indica]
MIMTTEQILDDITAAYIDSARADSFNGLIAATLLNIESDEARLRSHLSQLISEGRISCVFSRHDQNMHIKRYPDLPTGKQLALLDSDSLDQVAIYPVADEIEKRVDVSNWNDRPFTRALVLGEAQLAFRAFDMAALERYRNDPRYLVQFNDYMGRMSIRDDAFSDERFPERDKVSLQTFGLGFRDELVPHLVVYLRYLSRLSPEHQQYWKSYEVPDGVRMCEQYYQSSILGEFWKNRSIRYAIVKEMDLINRMSQAIWGTALFRELAVADVPIDLTTFLRPTSENYDRFVMALDKLLSDSINIKFFDGKVPLETESIREDGKIEVRRKGSLSLLEEWLLHEVMWEDKDAFREVIIAPLRKVRRERQAPAHTFSTDRFSAEYYATRRSLLWSVFNSLSNIRRTFGKHENATGIRPEVWLDEERIDVF